MIPKNIRKEHIIKAIEDIDKNGVPKRRESKKFYLLHNGNHYPPKYVVALANEFINGYFLDSDEFGGGVETNNFLRDLGFEIIDRISGTSIKISSKQKHKKTTLKKRHNERCPECKNRIEQLLNRLYGSVVINHKFDINVQIEDINDPDLKRIYKALTDYRGYKEFIRAKSLLNCDYYLPEQKMLVEFDESQHFTLARMITLENYPENVEIGYDIVKWISLCRDIEAKDNDPPYRDEQRAWYDTIRDFLPRLYGLKPIIRLYAGETKWCDLNPDNEIDLNKFKSYIEKGEINISIREDTNPFFARIIIAEDWKGDINESKEILSKICDLWQSEKKVNFLVTPGGFLQFDWPDLNRCDIGNNKDPDLDALNLLFEEAKKCINDFLTPDIKKKLKEHTKYITLGVDSHKKRVSTTQNYIGHLHTEMVCIYDLGNNREYWTGKSYPTSGQENGLVRIGDYNSHFVDLEDIGGVLVLGCHDLSIFNNRNWANTGAWRREIKKDFRELAKEKEPICVLHHPHTTVKIRTWLNSWSILSNMLPSVNQYIGAGRYHESNRERSKWDALDDVLKSTKCGNTKDFIVYKGGGDK
jgi:hypothetical protein